MNIPILKYVDVLIGLSLVMLLVATVALSISQALMKMCATRARHLADSLQPLIRQLHPSLLGPHAEELAEQLLLHPAVCQPRTPVSRLFGRIRRKLRIRGPMPTVDGRVAGECILREELAFCLLEWASGDWGWADPAKADVASKKAAEAEAAAAAAEKAASGNAIDAQALKAEAARARASAEAARVEAGAEEAVRLAVLKRQRDVAEALKQRGIEDPAATLRAVRLQALENEKAHPEQSAQLWRSQALAQVAPSDFVASLYQSFDTAMARATASFGSEAQVWVSAVALVLVAFLQLDTFHLVRRLSVDDSYRQTLIDEAKRLNDAQPSAPGQIPLPKDNSCDAYKLQDLEFQKCEIARSMNLLHSPSLDIWPDRGTFERRNIPGILVTWLLVSLGAPFWYDLLNNLFQLRSVLAQRDQNEQKERTTAAPSIAVAGKPSDSGAAVVKATTRPPANAPDPRAGAGDEDFGSEMRDLAAIGGRG